VENDQRHVGFMESVLRRPAMYTLGGTFLEVLAFLEGYHGGLSRVVPYAPPVVGWESFRKWLAARLGVPAQEAFPTLWRSQTDSDAALATMLECLQHYEREQPAR
jgi:hypothetical protein